jgi:rSAM/selenodomain-associated transferase 2
MNSSHKPALSIIIPALNEAHSIGETLSAISRFAIAAEVIVVDGGSADETQEITRAFGAKTISSERGRGQQMHRGVTIARGDVFWFLHADTIIPRGSVELIENALRDDRVVGGNFEVRFDGSGAAVWFMNWLYPQLRRLELIYGDSAIFVRREAYLKSGGFKSLPIFEDLDLLRRLKSVGEFAHLPATVITSSRRLEGGSFVITFTRWVVMQCLYWIGVNPEGLGRFYQPVRHAEKAARRNNSGLTDI